MAFFSICCSFFPPSVVFLHRDSETTNRVKACKNPYKKEIENSPSSDKRRREQFCPRKGEAFSNFVRTNHKRRRSRESRGTSFPNTSSNQARRFDPYREEPSFASFSALGNEPGGRRFAKFERSRSSKTVGSGLRNRDRGTKHANCKDLTVSSLVHRDRVLAWRPQRQNLSIEAQVASGLNPTHILYRGNARNLPGGSHGMES